MLSKVMLNADEMFISYLDRTYVWFAIFKLQVAAYDTKVNKMAFFDPTRAKDFLFIYGTKVFDSLLLY